MLKYLFTVEFTDGTVLKQTQEDKSSLDENRNAFYDVLNSKKDIKTITYNEQKLLNPTKIIIDYQTGVFNINGVDIYPEPIMKKDKELYVTERKPIRYMVVQQDFNSVYNLKSLKILNVKPGETRRTFYVGWKTNVGGKNFQRILGVK